MNQLKIQWTNWSHSSLLQSAVNIFLIKDFFFKKKTILLSVEEEAIEQWIDNKNNLNPEQMANFMMTIVFGRGSFLTSDKFIQCTTASNTIEGRHTVTITTNTRRVTFSIRKENAKEVTELKEPKQCRAIKIWDCNFWQIN